MTDAWSDGLLADHAHLIPRSAGCAWVATGAAAGFYVGCGWTLVETLATADGRMTVLSRRAVRWP